ncbi:MAG: tRNA (adenosine(37)-N6)-dimethylallyltransferase MiaA [Desulfobacterales bacterium]|nr:MAG: tRNA (adenosine(37)-N6)-dimethylallyltransferase MiaA [Desulfobacterales bacterium]
MNLNSPKTKVIIICGPTGIGKTAVGIHLAEKFGGEIISADSMQIYRHMDIGTAKPTLEERRRVPHHMIDIVDPDEDFDAVQFSDGARTAIAVLNRQGCPAFVVGGTGLYIKALLHGLFQSKPVDPKIRKRLKQELEQSGSSFLYERLEQIDPDTAERLHPNDSYRIIRALETIESSGESISKHHQNHGFEDDPLNALKIGLKIDRTRLYERIDHRVDLMIQAGLVEEVRKLLAMGYSAELKSMQSIGYRHMVEFLAERLPWGECVRTLKRDTRRFAKRQFTWFGADAQIKWYEPDQVNEIMSLVERFLK